MIDWWELVGEQRGGWAPFCRVYRARPRCASRAPFKEVGWETLLVKRMALASSNCETGPSTSNPLTCPGRGGNEGWNLIPSDEP